MKTEELQEAPSVSEGGHRMIVFSYELCYSGQSWYIGYPHTISTWGTSDVEQASQTGQESCNEHPQDMARQVLNYNR